MSPLALGDQFTRQPNRLVDRQNIAFCDADMVRDQRNESMTID